MEPLLSPGIEANSSGTMAACQANAPLPFEDPVLDTPLEDAGWVLPGANPGFPLYPGTLPPRRLLFENLPLDISSQKVLQQLPVCVRNDIVTVAIIPNFGLAPGKTAVVELYKHQSVEVLVGHFDKNKIGFVDQDGEAWPTTVRLMPGGSAPLCRLFRRLILNEKATRAIRVQSVAQDGVSKILNLLKINDSCISVAWDDATNSLLIEFSSLQAAWGAKGTLESWKTNGFLAVEGFFHHTTFIYFASPIFVRPPPTPCPTRAFIPSYRASPIESFDQQSYRPARLLQRDAASYADYVRYEDSIVPHVVVDNVSELGHGYKPRVKKTRIPWGWRQTREEFEKEMELLYIDSDDPYWQRSLDLMYRVQGKLNLRKLVKKRERKPSPANLWLLLR